MVIQWERYRRVSELAAARSWLKIQYDLGRAPNTVDAYGRALEEYLAFCSQQGLHTDTVTREHIAKYVRNLLERPNSRGTNMLSLDSGAGLARATISQRLTVVRLFYDYLVEEGIRSNNPVGRGRYRHGNTSGGSNQRGILPTFHTLPWIPNEEEWLRVLEAAREESSRNRFMFALAYDGGLRREELCLLETADLDAAHRTIRIRAETTKNRRERVVPYSEAVGALYSNYLQERRTLSRERGPLFRSMSNRNKAEPISKWTWSKVMRGIAKRADLPRFSSHTLRHLCLTDLARADWDIHEIAKFAGHSSIETTLRYIHLSGRELAAKFQRGMEQIHSWRTKIMAEEFRNE